uniref:Tpd52 like 2a n=1 Tax=Oncorhynchus kisutch TaxID=8019 RepID=A0A8C7DXH4_ONCKI
MVCISDSNIYTPLKGCSGENVSPRNISIGISRNGLTNCLSEEDEDDLKMELAKTEDEMQTLRQVLLAKEKYAVDIKRQLGMGPFSEIKHNMSKGWHEVQTSNIESTHSLPLCVSRYKMTHDTISHAGQISTAAMSTMGVAITRRLGEMRYPQPSLYSFIILPYILPFFPSSFTTSKINLSTIEATFHIRHLFS